MRDGLTWAVLCVLFTARASAGVYIETADKAPGAKAKLVTAQRIWVQGGSARFEAEGQVTLLKGDALYILDPAERSYTVVDEAAAAKLGKQLNDPTAQMREQLAGLPPEQRAMVEQMMGGRMPGPAAPRAKLEAVDTGRSETVDGRSCRNWLIKRGGVTDEQHCVVAFGTLPGNEDLRALFARMAKLFEALQGAMPQLAEGGFEDEAAVVEKMNGFPVLSREYANGKPNGAETRVVAWRAESVPASQFAIPAGYKQRELAAGPSD